MLHGLICWRFTCRTPTRLSIVALLTVFLTAAAMAQPQRGDGPRGPGARFAGMMGGFSMERLLRPDFHARDLAIFSQQLELDHSQRPIFEMLLEDYREAFRDAAYELDRALRHRQLQRIEDRMQWNMDRMRGQAIEAPGDGHVQHFVVADDSAVTISASGRGEIQVQGSAGMLTFAGNTSAAAAPAAGTRIVMVQDAAPPDDAAEQKADDAVDSSPQISDEMQERIDRMRERIRERMQQRLDQQREEMRQRGIDPDEEVEPLEVDEIAALARTLLQEKRRLRNRFESDANLVLADWQRESLPRALRTVRRLNGLQDSRLSGEQIDLVRILEDERLRPEDDPSLDAVLDRYLIALDDTIQARSQFLERADIDMFVARHTDDSEAIMGTLDRAAELRVAVRSVNDVYAEHIAAALPESDRDQFIAAVESQAYPQLSGLTRLQRVFERVLAHDDLAPAQSEAIEHMQHELAHDAASYRDKAIVMIREREVNQPREMIEFVEKMRELRGDAEAMRQIDWREFRPPMPPEFEVRQQRAEMESTYLRLLRGAIPEPMFAQIIDEDDSARSLIESIDRQQNRRRGGRWQRRGANEE